MKPVRPLGQRFWRVGEPKHSHQAGGREHPQPVRLIVPERIEWVWLRALQLSDLVFIPNVMLKTCEMIEALFENRDLALVGAGLLQLRQRLPGEVPERDTIGTDVVDQGRGGQVQGNASFALDLCKCLELGQGRNIDVKHGPSLSAGAETLVRPD